MVNIINTLTLKMFLMSKTFISSCTTISKKVINGGHRGGQNEIQITGWLGRFLSLFLVFIASGSVFADPAGSTSSPGVSTASNSSQVWFTPEVVAILTTAAVALFCAILHSRSALRIARKRAAMDAIMESKRDESLQEGMAFIREVDKDNQKSIETYYNPECSSPEERSHILYVLNHYENVAVAIHKSIYDNDIYKSAQFTIVKNLVEQTESFIKKVQRHDSPTAFQELIALNTKWLANPVKTEDAGKAGTFSDWVANLF
ncbi:DUF4760 domain-containing protein [Microbulbifer sp. ANSA003]|uniref:DUF4760 domain-containing protein n=1 Tax=Microbulbifer sp. ANSA003 TaxID=3243360 RepID=UPI0040414F09